MISGLFQPLRQRVRVLEAHRGERPEHDEVERSLKELDAVILWTRHPSEPDPDSSP